MVENIGIGQSITVQVTPYLTVWDYILTFIILFGIPAISIYGIYRLIKHFRNNSYVYPSQNIKEKEDLNEK